MKRLDLGRRLPHDDEIEHAMVIGEKNHEGYLERIALPHQTWEKRRCHALRIGRGRGRNRPGICFLEQSVGLYPTVGSTDDYAYSRHSVDSSKTKIIAYTMEWGRTRASTPFHPPYPEMRKVMREVTAGLLEFCLEAK